MLTSKNILITGGAGYIGSHTVIELLKENYQIVIVDNFSNSKPEVLEKIERISGKKVPFYNIDLCDAEKLKLVFKEHKFETVIHFAGLKAVGESVTNPLSYYSNNLISTLNLCLLMQKNGVKNLIFSSSATVYGEPSELPLKETSRIGVGITNPYGQTKYQIETILKDLTNSDPKWKIFVLRYFNPIGAHQSGLIGEDPKDTPNNLLPILQRVAVGKIDKIKIFGNDYPTLDGTGVRDYIHVTDLALGHLASLKKIEETKIGRYQIYNLGTGRGTSVLELINAFEEAVGKKIPYEIVGRRSGDVAECYASPEKANNELGWSTKRSLKDACEDAWRWQSQIN